jgi:hypothetical protein
MEREREAAAKALLQAYREHVRPFFEEQQLPGTEALDRQAELLDQALRRPSQVHVGFVGEAQVGKSTLINAVVDRTALPAGGIGPLTARATSVTYTEEDAMTVRYHGKRALNRLIFAMTRYLEMLGEVPKGSAEVSPESVPEEDLAIAEFPEDADSVSGSEQKEISEQTREKGEYMLLQAQRMLGVEKHDAHSARALFVDAMRAVIGLKVGDPASLAPFRTRIEELQRLVGAEEVITRATPGGRDKFNAELKLRAAGWLSPLIAELKLGLNSDLIRGLSLVDLPGIGTVGDPAARVAKDFVERDGHALVIVFRNSGVTEAIADLLERTGVVTRMLFGGRDGHAAIHLLLAVTHLDNVARTRFREEALLAREAGRALPDPNEIFRALCAEMEEKLRSQVRAALRQSDAFADLTGELLSSRETVVDQLCQNMQVVCLAAPDYIDIMTNLGLQTGLLTDAAATGIPRFREALRSLARAAEQQRERDIDLHDSNLRKNLIAHLRILRDLYSEGRGAAIEEWERFSAELQKRLIPIREEMQAYHGETLAVLRRGLLERIRNLCQTAEAHGNKRLQRLTKQGRELHYMSLRAALTRNGVWERRNVNYPDALTLAVLDAIATQWEPEIIEAVRSEIRSLADRDLALVDKLVTAATELNPALVAESQIEAQKKILQQNSRSAVAWTREQLEDLREKVREKLRGAIEPPIVKACKRALAADRHRGTGAKGQILEVFEEGGSEALGDASKAAETILKQQYSALIRKLDDGYLKEHHDPVAAAFESLTNETGRKAQRQDRQRRQGVLATVDRFMSELATSEQAA